MKKEYLVLVVIIAALAAYLFMDKKDKTHYTLPELAVIKKNVITKIDLQHGGRLQTGSSRRLHIVGKDKAQCDHPIRFQSRRQGRPRPGSPHLGSEKALLQRPRPFVESAVVDIAVAVGQVVDPVPLVFEADRFSRADFMEGWKGVIGPQTVVLPAVPHRVHIEQLDAVIIVTDHSDYDIARIVKHSKIIVDTRNATAGITTGREKIVMA